MITAQDMEDMGYFEKVKPLTGQSPLDMVQAFSKIMGQTPDPELYSTLIQEEFEEWLDSLLHKDQLNEIKELSDLLYVVFGYANAKGWDIMEAFERVHKNNVGRCIQPDGSIKRREDGKIIKNKDYPKVDLEDLVN